MAMFISLRRGELKCSYYWKLIILSAIVAENKWMESQYLPAYPLPSQDILDPSNMVTDNMPQQYYLSAWTATTCDENICSQ
jgi:hypothetical protein